MDGNEPLMYIEKIVLEIVDRRRHRFWFHQCRDQRIETFNIGKFNTREAAYAFLQQSHGEPFIKSQKITIWYNKKKLYLFVRDLIYGKINGISNTMVQFIYPTGVFSEVKWPAVTVNHTTQELSVDDDTKSMSNTSIHAPDVHFDSDCCSINVDETTYSSTQVVPCISCNNLDYDQTLGGESMSKDMSNSFCRDCRVRRSVSDLQRLIAGDDETFALGHGPGNDDHFRSSIYIHITQI